MQAKYVHTNLIAKDWRKLAQFYTEVFGCIFIPPERDYQGEALEAGTGLKGAHLTGVHLRLPGYGDTGPTIEIFSYAQLEARPETAVNRPGFAHIAFEVDNVEAAQREVEAHGGNMLGEIVTMTTKIGTKVTWCYLTDPEGNVIELQSWEK
jgi:predicted enzyme related to lactoylglutathione lyase